MKRSSRSPPGIRHVPRARCAPVCTAYFARSAVRVGRSAARSGFDVPARTPYSRMRRVLRPLGAWHGACLGEVHPAVRRTRAYGACSRMLRGLGARDRLGTDRGARSCPTYMARKPCSRKHRVLRPLGATRRSLGEPGVRSRSTYPLGHRAHACSACLARRPTFGRPLGPHRVSGLHGLRTARPVPRARTARPAPRRPVRLHSVSSLRGQHRVPGLLGVASGAEAAACTRGRLPTHAWSRTTGAPAPGGLRARPTSAREARVVVALARPARARRLVRAGLG